MYRNHRAAPRTFAISPEYDLVNIL